jgi:hypothetical protein
LLPASASPVGTPKLDRLAKPSSQLSTSFTFPLASGSMSLAGSSPIEGELSGLADEDAISKGGHSLRKRKPKTYSNYDLDDPGEDSYSASRLSNSASARSKKRKPGPNQEDEDSDDFLGSSSKRPRRNLRQEAPSPISGRRRQPTRRSAVEPKVYEEIPSDHDVKDTIEVGVTLEDSEYSEEQSSLSLNQSEASKATSDQAATTDHQTPASKEQNPNQQSADVSRSRGKDASALEITRSPRSSPATTPSKEDTESPPSPTQLPLDTNASSARDVTVKLEPPPEHNQMVVGSSVARLSSLILTIKVDPRALRKLFQQPSSPIAVEETVVEDEHEATKADQVVLQRSTEEDLTKEHVIFPEEINKPASSEASSSGQLDAEEPSNQDLREGEETSQVLAVSPADVEQREIGSEAMDVAQDANDTPPASDGHRDRHGDLDAIPQGNMKQSPRKPAPLLSRPRMERKESYTEGRFSNFSLRMLNRAEQAVQAVETKTGPPGPYTTSLSPYVGGYVYYPEVQEESPAGTPAPEMDDDTPGQLSDAAKPTSADIPILDLPEVQEQGEGLLHPTQNARETSVMPTPVDTPRDTPMPDDFNASFPASGVNLEATSRALEEIEQPTPSRKQFRFRELRDPKDIVVALKDVNTLPPKERYLLLEQVSLVLQTWQEEYNQLRKFTDDEDNAVRRRQQDIALDAKTAMALKKNNPEINVPERDFAVKGIRARETPVDPIKEQYRVMDKLMSQVYFFEHDPRESMVGRQDPEGQREGLQNTRLRNRPKQTQKAAEAEADETLVLGKRTRRKRALSNEMSREPSRAGTPVVQIQPQRRARRAAAGSAQQENGDAQKLLPDANESLAARKPSRRQRGAKSLLSNQALTHDEFEETEQQEDDSYRGRNHKRARLGTDDSAPSMSSFMVAEPMQNEPPPPTAPKGQLRITVKNKNGEIPVRQFYVSTTSPTTEDSPPVTPASDADTVESNYSTRPKRVRKPKTRTDEELEQPAAKRQRTTATRVVIKNTAQGHSAPPNIAPAPSILPPLPAGRIHITTPGHSSTQARRPLKIKAYYPGNPGSAANPLPLAPAAPPVQAPRSSSSSRVTTPVPIPQPQFPPPPSSDMGDDDSEKDYRQMTKSEKMSHSMKSKSYQPLLTLYHVLTPSSTMGQRLHGGCGCKA